MAQSPDLEARVSALETEVRELAELNAMRDDMVDGFAEMRGKLDAAAAGQQQIAGMLSTLIARDDDQASPG